MTKKHNRICVCLQLSSLKTLRTVWAMAFSSKHPPPSGFPVVSSGLLRVRSAKHRRRAERVQSRRCGSRHLCRSLAQHGLGKQQQQQQSPVLLLTYVGVAERLLRMYRSAAARFRELLRPPQDQQRQRAKDAVNGKRHLGKHWCDVFFSLFVAVCCADALQCRSSGRLQRHPPLFFFFFLPTQTWRRQQHRTVRALSSGLQVTVRGVIGALLAGVCSSLFTQDCFLFWDQGGFIKLPAGLLPRW